ncbi:VWA domain-containing protein [Aliidiomarina minuta]|uniref:VWA domain-containing protein n=1 Tax=Aliidiomarina minuta TaxID=880057 RepID=UPI0013006730|nr:VWA domain-containing protein [Aliidiomarina minuta]
MFEFAWWWILLLFPLPWLVRHLTPVASKQRTPLPLPNAARLIQASNHQLPGSVRLWLLPVLTWLALLSALAQPQWVGEPVTLQEERREIMIALDLSASMQADDMTLNGRQATRLEAAHHILADFIERRKGDRVGLIVYADSAYVYAPITRDLNTVAQLAREAQIGLAGQRTALGDAIGLSIRYFTERESEEQVVLMLTDGMINTGVINAEEALHLASSHDVKIHTIGIGSEEMVVRGIFGERRINPSADLDEVFLNQIAEASGGQYFRARNSAEMEQIYRLIDQIEPIQDEENSMRPRKALFHWPLALAFVLALLHLCSMTVLSGGRRV